MCKFNLNYLLFHHFPTLYVYIHIQLALYIYISSNRKTRPHATTITQCKLQNVLMCNVSTYKCLDGKGKNTTSASCRGHWQHGCKLRVHILVNVLVGTGNHHQHKLQVVPTASASEVFALINARKNTSTSCRGSRPSWALVGTGCSNQMQVAQGQSMVKDFPLYI